MKTKQYFKSFLVLTLLLLVAVSCNDVWDDHYSNDVGAGIIDAPSLWEHILADPALEPFCKVAKHVGYDAVLQSPQSFTLWAPVITQEQADSVIAVYEAEKREVDNNGNLRKDQDNAAIIQFMQNHMAMAGRPVNSLTNDSIRMWNGKYMVLTSTSLNNVPFVDKNIIARNGVLHKLQRKQNFFHNLREVLEQKESLDSVAHFYHMFDSYELDEQASVVQDVINGEVVYADSVMRLSNSLYSWLGYINREDSSYIYLAPTKELWKKEYEKYYNWFSYVDDSKLSNRDSVRQMNARMAINRGRYFNNHIQRRSHDPQKDSLTNTLYWNSKDSWGLNVFHHPMVDDGILAGLTPIQCSNGLLYEDATGRIADTLTFRQKRYIQPWIYGNYKSRLIATDGDTYSPVVTKTTRKIVDKQKIVVGTTTEIDPETGEEVEKDIVQEVRFPELKDQQYAEFSPASYKNTSITNIELYFYLQNTFSNLYYNVYVVMVPEFAREKYDPEKIRPVPFKVFFSERNEKSTSSTDKKDPDAGQFGKETSALKVPEGETHGSGIIFEAKGNAVELICIDKARKFNFASYNAFTSMSATQRYRFYSNANRSELIKNTKSNILRINRLIYIPFETEQEAKDFKLELSDLSNLKEYKE